MARITLLAMNLRSPFNPDPKSEQITMTNPRSIEQSLGSLPHCSYQSRREFVEALAYSYWIQRGQPLGSPEADWFSAERDLYYSLVAAGMITLETRENLGKQMYRRTR